MEGTVRLQLPPNQNIGYLNMNTNNNINSMNRKGCILIQQLRYTCLINEALWASMASSWTELFVFCWMIQKTDGKLTVLKINGREFLIRISVFVIRFVCIYIYCVFCQIRSRFISSISVKQTKYIYNIQYSYGTWNNIWLLHRQNLIIWWNTICEARCLQTPNDVLEHNFCWCSWTLLLSN